MAAKRNRHLAALRGFFDRLVQRNVCVLNSASSIEGVTEPVIEGKTPEDTLIPAKCLGLHPRKNGESLDWARLLAIHYRRPHQQRRPHPMWPERQANSEMTLRRFCRWRRIPLDDVQRTVIGVGLSKRAAERQIPVRKVKERLDSGFWSWGRVYPRAFLEEWLREYRAGLPGDQAAALTKRRAENSSSSVPDSGLLAQ